MLFHQRTVRKHIKNSSTFFVSGRYCLFLTDRFYSKVYSIGSQAVPPPGGGAVGAVGGREFTVWGTYLFWIKYGHKVKYIFW
jgi:hypothetical protein